jgi:prophage regulatory protein
MNQIYRLPEVIKLTGMSRSAIYQAIKDSSFPKQVRISMRSVGWLKSDIEEWIDDKVDTSSRNVLAAHKHRGGVI